jgi:hypothetical protein
VKFKLNAKGMVTQIVEVTASDGAPEAEKRACVAAIGNPAPYGKWTPDMISVLGTEEELMFTFYYESE